jgi:N-ethylmaleimide reductase
MNFPALFSPLKIGPYQLKHRLVMAPLTRMRAEKPSLAPRALIPICRAGCVKDCR